MSVVAPELPGAKVLDLFAGSGALGLEALSRGASHCTFVESDARALAVLKANVAALDAADRSDAFRTDALKYAAALEAPVFDLAFADPPYAKGLARALAEAFAARPFAELLCLEHGKGDELPPLPGARTRRYGDTLLTFIRAPA
jgi:16S rRNA (guanine966-N2)-methyltransferase